MVLIALVRLARPHNGLITAASVAVGALTAGALSWSAAGWAALAAALVGGAGNAFNDLCDIEIDRVNRPARPLPAGLVGRRAAAVWTLALAAAGIGCAYWAAPSLGIFAAGVTALLALYSLALKRTALAGNLAVALAAAAAFPFGALSNGHLGRSWIPAGFAFLYHLGRELVKDIEDLEGDARLGARTAPVCWGTAPTAILAAAVFALLAALTWAPPLLGLYGWPYAVPVLLVNAHLLAAVLFLRRHHRALPPGALSRRLLLGMLIGLAAVVAGELLPPP